jgi:hypothetical protein
MPAELTPIEDLDRHILDLCTGIAVPPVAEYWH